MATIETTLFELRKRNGFEIITQKECNDAGENFPDDNGKVPYCGFFYGRGNKPVSFWLYRNFGAGEHTPVTISLGDSAGSLDK